MEVTALVIWILSQTSSMVASKSAMKAMISATISMATLLWSGTMLSSVYFGFDSSSVAASERLKLQEAAEHLEQNSEDHLLVEGHCDWYGTSEYNLALGDRRASSISDYLYTLGITPERIESFLRASLEAISGSSKELSFKDRRADLIILKK